MSLVRSHVPRDTFVWYRESMVERRVPSEDADALLGLAALDWQKINSQPPFAVVLYSVEQELHGVFGPFGSWDDANDWRVQRLLDVDFEGVPFSSDSFVVELSRPGI